MKASVLVEKLVSVCAETAEANMHAEVQALQKDVHARMGELVPKSLMVAEMDQVLVSLPVYVLCVVSSLRAARPVDACIVSSGWALYYDSVISILCAVVASVLVVLIVLCCLICRENRVGLVPADIQRFWRSAIAH